MNVDIKDFQYKILEIAFYFDEFCKKYDIEYYLMGGSALGAVRHHGFIPWDDDFDVFMTFNNYHKFLHYASIHLDTEKFHLQRENSTEWPLFFSKLRMNGTTCIEKGYNKMHLFKILNHFSTKNTLLVGHFFWEGSVSQNEFSS